MEAFRQFPPAFDSSSSVGSFVGSQAVGLTDVQSRPRAKVEPAKHGKRGRTKLCDVVGEAISNWNGNFKAALPCAALSPAKVESRASV
jgi:hypothetical protein